MNEWQLRMMSARDAFEANAFPEPNSGCWIWTGTVRGVDDNLRPVMRLDGEAICAYRFSYVHFTGAIPDGMFVCHHCHNGLCVNPDHLYAGTAQQNTDDMMRSGRHFSQGNNNPKAMENLRARALRNSKAKLLKPTCIRGHLLDDKNMYASPLGRRICKACCVVRHANSRLRNDEKRRSTSQ